MGIKPTDEVARWLRIHGNMTQQQFQDHLSRNLPKPTLFTEIRLMDEFQLRVKVAGILPDQTSAWIMPFIVIPYKKLAIDLSIWIARAQTEQTHGRILLRNFVEAMELFGVTKIHASPSGGRSFAYPQAGFVPFADRWMVMRERLKAKAHKIDGWQQLALTSKQNFEEIFASNNPNMIRNMTPSPFNGQDPNLIVNHRELCYNILFETDWAGELNFEDHDSENRFRHYAVLP